MQLIETVELASAQTTVEFTSIPSNGQDLCVVASILAPSQKTRVNIVLNSDTGANYSAKYILADADEATDLTSNSESGQNEMLALYSGAFDHPSNNFYYFTDYRSSNEKTVSFRGTNEPSSGGAARMTWGLAEYSGTSPISSIEFSLASGDFQADSVFSLYVVNTGSDGTTVVS